MTPAAQSFYNLLVAHYLNDELIATKCKQYITAKIRTDKGFVPIARPLEDLELKAKLDSLTDEEWSAAIKSFDIHYGVKAKGFTDAFSNGAGITVSLQPYQKAILGNWK